MNFQEFLTTVTEKECDWIAGLDYGQHQEDHRKALNVVIANGGKVDVETQGVWFPLEVWAVCEIGMTEVALARLLQISQPAVAHAVSRGEKLD